MQIALRWQPVSVIATAIGLLSGCGGSNGLPVSSSSSGSSMRSGVLPRPATTGDLLYVANRFTTDGVSVLTFPQGTLVATIKHIGKVGSICSDSSGNVWMTTFGRSQPFYIYRFRHGGTKPVEALSTRRYANGCAVDPKTGDLAVISYGGSEDGVVDIWRGARKGRPTVRYVGIPPAACAYDNDGDLFVDGAGGAGVALQELVEGNKNFTNVDLGNNAGWTVGSVQWDGRYVAIGAGTISGSSSIYRVQVSGTRGKIVDMVHLQHLASWPHFVIANGEIVATQRGKIVRRAGLYEYPSGGKRLAVFSGFDNPTGITISVPRK